MPAPLRVLILEDRESDALLVVHELRRAGFSPAWQRVESEEDYLTHLEPTLDIILADYSLPQFDALRALDLLREREIDIPFIIVSGNMGEDIAVRAMRGGAADYLLKDRLARLGQAVTQALERKKQRQERQQAADALRESEERYRLLFENNPHPMWVFDVETLIFMAVNEAAIRHYGYSREEFLAMSIQDIRPPADVPALLEQIPQKFVEFDTPQIRRHLKKDGTPIDVEVRSHPLDFAGRPARLVLANDITERRRAEEEQRRLQAAIERSAWEWQLTFDAIESPVFILDPTGLITKLNAAAKELAGGSDSELVGRPIECIGSSQPWPKAAELVDLIRKRHAPTSCQARDEASGRTWDLASSLAPGTDVSGASDERIILVIRDITRTVELQASLHRSETMSLLGSLVSGVAHEVRNPLFGISSTLDAFEARFGVKDEYIRYLSILRGEVNRLSNLMRDLLNYGRPSGHELSPGSITEVIAEAVQECEPLAKQSQVNVINQVTTAMAPICMDHKRLPQVFLNLIENAIQHSPSGSSVTVEANEVWKDSQGWITCFVKDSGPGFKPEDLPHLFEPFFTKRRGGTGLGLSIVQKMVEAHGGKISMSNRPEGGAEIMLKFPVVKAGQE